MTKFKRTPLKTLPWEKMSIQLQQAVQAWIDSGGDPAKLAAVEKLTKAVRAAHAAELPPRPKLKMRGRVPGYMRDDVSLYARVLEAKDTRRKPGSVEWPEGHGSQGRDPSKRLLPGEAGMMSKKQLGYRSHRQRVERSGNRVVTFSNGIAEKTLSVIESTPLRAAREARKRAKLGKMWKIIKIDGVTWKGPQK